MGIPTPVGRHLCSGTDTAVSVRVGNSLHHGVATGVIDISGRKKIDPLNLAPAKSNGTPLRKSVDTVVATAGYAKSGDENDAVLGGAL
jgi:hypothetical protein